jgi:hypothetical protein
MIKIRFSPWGRKPQGGDRNGKERETPTMLNSEIAKIAYEVNRAYRAAISEDPGPAWDDADIELQRSMSHAVNYHRHVTLSFADSHELWMKHKIEEGWKWGAQKDTKHKLHPCLVNWNALPQSQRVKDVLFTTIVRLLRDIG